MDSSQATFNTYPRVTFPVAPGWISAVYEFMSYPAIVITLAMQSAASKAIDEATGVSSSQSSAKGSAKNQPKGDQDMEGDLKTMHVKIVSAVRSNNDYNNQPTVLVTFEWTNNTDKNNSVGTGDGSMFGTLIGVCRLSRNGGRRSALRIHVLRRVLVLVLTVRILAVLPVRILMIPK